MSNLNKLTKWLLCIFVAFVIIFCILEGSKMLAEYLIELVNSVSVQ